MLLFHFRAINDTVKKYVHKCWIACLLVKCGNSEHFTFKYFESWILLTQFSWVEFKILAMQGYCNYILNLRKETHGESMFTIPDSIRFSLIMHVLSNPLRKEVYFTETSRVLLKFKTFCHWLISSTFKRLHLTALSPTNMKTTTPPKIELYKKRHNVQIIFSSCMIACQIFVLRLTF